jgi:hypothetical protein
VKRTWLRNGAMQALRLLACGIFFTALAGCEGQIIGPPGGAPAERSLWLSYKYSAGGCTDPNTNCPEIINQVEENAYYCSIAVTGDSAANGEPLNCADPQSPKLKLEHWKDANGFPVNGTSDAHAIYGNAPDLQIARDMNCVKSANGNIACYVTNYGPPPFDNVHRVVNPDWIGLNNEFPGLTGGIEDAITKDTPFATVAMVYNRSAALSQSANAVTFYVFNGLGDLLPLPALDGEGGKTSPRMCMACHGGTYDSGTHSVRGAQFLPFDVFLFKHSMQPGYTLDDQQEEYRKLNALVKETQPAAAIADFINGTYNNTVDTAGTLAVNNYVPQGWSGQETLYSGVYRQYCRMCHLASRTPFLTFAQFQNFAVTIEDKVCQSTDMPNAQVPYLKFWEDTIAQEDLRRFLRGEGLTNLHNCK